MNDKYIFGLIIGVVMLLALSFGFFAGVQFTDYKVKNENKGLNEALNICSGNLYELGQHCLEYLPEFCEKVV